MECTHNNSNRNWENHDLIDLNSEDESQESRDEPGTPVVVENSAPLLRSDQRINSGIVAIKHGNGDLGFVAIGRFNNKSVPKHKKSKSTSSNNLANDSVREIPLEKASRVSGGIVNPGYSTISSRGGDRYTYDETGKNYFSSYPHRWNNVDLSNHIVGSGVPSHDHENDATFIDIPQEDLVNMKNHGNDVVYGGDQLWRSDMIVDIPHSSQCLHTERSRSVSPEIVPAEESYDCSHNRQASPTALNINIHEGNENEEDSTFSNQNSQDNPDLCQGQTLPDSNPVPKLPPHCKMCGQRHRVSENHEYDYINEVDEDLMCDICLQPLVDPYDTKCGHTFCAICIKNYLRVKQMCPVDRQELLNMTTDCWQSSLVLRKLINKLVISCPHEEFCKETMPRCDLECHLKEKCQGAVIRCTKSMYGCLFKGPRVSLSEHIETCEYRELTDKLSNLHPYSEDLTVELFRPEGLAELGISIVGGSDTPLHYIIIQEITSGGLAEQDGRLHAGDVIVDLNSESFYSVTHCEARAALIKPSNLMRFGLLRDVSVHDDPNGSTSIAVSRKSSSFKSPYDEEIVPLVKPPLEQLGIRISSSETGTRGVYIVELVEGQVAHSDGRLMQGDRIMAINETDLTDSTPEQAARVIGSCDGEVKIYVRHMMKRPMILCNEWSQDKAKMKVDVNKEKTSVTGITRSSSIPPPPKVKHSYVKKVVSVKKNQKENLGIIVSGGFDCVHGNLPIFVQDVLPMSVLGKDNRIKRGDLLSQINSYNLIGLTHSQSMNILRESAQQREVTLVAYELIYEGMAEDAALWDELTSFHHQPNKWAPSWRMWLSIPPEFILVQEISLRKLASSSYGIKITGGFTIEHGPAPIFVSHVSQSCQSGACKYLKCGDEIIAVNKRYVKGMAYGQVLKLMKSANCVSLKYISWPGSHH